VNSVRSTFCIGIMVVSVFSCGRTHGAELLIGTAAADITPDRPVPLTGMKTVRVSEGILSRCTANVLALESRDGEKVLDQAILVSCDLCVIRSMRSRCT